MYLLASGVPGEDIAVPAWLWVFFLVVVIGLICFDLVLHRDDHEISVKEAAGWSAFWIVISLAFGGLVFAVLGASAGTQYLTGYVIEKSLSVDNVFVWAVILGYFAVPKKLQHRVLFWGIFGALVLRAIFIFAGVALIETFDWILYVFGAFLVYSGIKIARHSGEEMHPEKNPVLRICLLYTSPSPRDS